MRKWKEYLVMALAAILLTGCQSKNVVTNSASDMGLVQETAAGSTYMANSYSMEIADPESGSVEKAAQLPDNQMVDRKLIKNVTLGVETEDFDGLISELYKRVNEAGGYMEDSSISGNSYYYRDDSRYANLTIRIPGSALDEFVNQVAEISNVTRKNESIQDITLQYVDVESHKLALATEQERLLALLEKAETVEDIIAIEGRLSEVRYQLQSYESQLRTMDNQVDYSTVYIDISEVKKLTPQKELNVWERIQTGFSENLVSLGEGMRDLFVVIIVSIPYLAVWGLIITAGALAGRRIYKTRKLKAQKKDLNTKEKDVTAEKKE